MLGRPDTVFFQRFDKARVRKTRRRFCKMLGGMDPGQFQNVTFGIMRKIDLRFLFLLITAKGQKSVKRSVDPAAFH